MLVALLLLVIQSTALADDVTYDYDALGRLIKVERSDGTQTIYSLDAAGNRVEVQEAVPPGIPATISVPASSATGSFTVNWSAPSTGSVQFYELYESTSSNFSAQTKIYSGTGTGKAVSGKTDGTYYYRVRACGIECSGYRAGANGATVTLPPGAPASISVPATSSTGSYTINWGASTGVVTSYELYQSTSSDFSNQVRIYNGTATSSSVSGRGDGSYYYRVRACNSSCGSYTAATNAMSVLLPPGTPGSISVPTGSVSGSYTVSWGGATGTVTAYELYEATNSSFTGAMQVYSGTAANFAATGRSNGTYYYRVRACNTNCSGYATGANGTVVTLPPGAPASISAPSSSVVAYYTVSWGAASGALTAYELYEATNASFSGAIQLYSGTGTNYSVAGQANGTYYYRVRACNVSACSNYTTAGNPTNVTLPPGAPASISAPSSSNSGSYSVYWGTASGHVTAYEVYEATNSSFSGQSLIYSSTGTSTSVSGRGNGTYYYRVRACNVGACGAYTTAANSIVVTLPPSAPSWTSVPASSTTGSYTVSWGAATGTLTTYELWESANSSFSAQTLILSNTGTSYFATSKPNGTYYYRVRACNVGSCSGYAAGANPVVVAIQTAPPAPTGLWSTQNSMCSWAAYWNASPGATSYNFRDASGYHTMTVTTTQVSYSFTSCSISPNSEKPKWVEACNGANCSSKVNFP